MEGRAEGKTKGQFGPNGSGRGPTPTTPHRTSGETEEGGAMLPLRSPRTHVQGMPQEGQQTPPLHQSPSNRHSDNKHHHRGGSYHLPNGNGRGKGQPPGGGAE